MIKEGYMPFKEGQTYYRIVGDLDSGKAPLVLLHGGPGSTHNYFEVLDPLAKEDDRALVMYDQIGCGNSFIEGHNDYFTAPVWIEELILLREHLGLEQIHLLGQSWGGMMAIWYACDYKPQGIKSYILTSTLSSAKLWEEEQHRNISYMEPEYRDALMGALENDDYDDPAYLEALDVFMLRHSFPKMDESVPECVRRPKRSGSTAYLTGWGRNEFTPSGTLSGYEFTDRLCEIETPALVISGQRDLSTPLIAKTMYDNLPNAKWELFQYSRHAPFIEETPKYLRVLKEWLNEHD